MYLKCTEEEYLAFLLGRGWLQLERSVYLVCLEHSECWLQLKRSAYLECSKHLVQLEVVVRLERTQ